MLIVLKQLNVHHGDPGLRLWASSLPTLAEGESILVGTLNPPEHKGGCASDWTPRYFAPREAPLGAWEHSEMLPPCGDCRQEQGAPWPTPSNKPVPQRLPLGSHFPFTHSPPPTPDPHLLTSSSCSRVVTKSCLNLMLELGIFLSAKSTTECTFEFLRIFLEIFFVFLGESTSLRVSESSLQLRVPLTGIPTERGSPS